MKIAIDVSDLSTNRADGTTRYTYELAKRLPALAPEHNWYYLAPTIPLGPFSTRRVEKNVTVHMAPFPKYWTQLRFPFELYQHKPDVLFMPIQQLPYIRPKKMRTVAVIHDLAFHYFGSQFTYKDWVLLHAFTAYVAREADHIICVSHSTADDVQKFYGRTKNVHVIHHGVNHKQFHVPSQAERDASWAKLEQTFPSANLSILRNIERSVGQIKKPYILFVGQIQPRKNLVRLIEAFEMLRRKNKELQLVIAGSHGWLQKPIVERIKKSSEREHIVLTGRVPDELLPALYWNAAVFVLPSLYEGFGMPILEAQACGTPVVTSNISSMPEIVGDSAVLINPVDTASLVAGVRKAFQDTRKVSEAGIRNATRFNWQATAQKTASVLMGN